MINKEERRKEAEQKHPCFFHTDHFSDPVVKIQAKFGAMKVKVPVVSGFTRS
jgi:hypothetical protein